MNRIKSDREEQQKQESPTQGCSIDVGRAATDLILSGGVLSIGNWHFPFALSILSAAIPCPLILNNANSSKPDKQRNHSIGKSPSLG